MSEIERDRPDATPDKSDDPSRPMGDDFLERVLNDMEDPFFVFGSDWKFRFVNDAASRMMRQTPEELLGRTVYETFPEATAGSAFTRVYEDAMELGVPQSFEAFFPPADKWLEVRVQPYHDGVSVRLTDVSTRHQIAEELRKNQQMLSALLGNHDIGMSIGSPDGSVVFYNRAMEDLSGYSAEDVAEHGWFDLVFPDEAERAAAAYLASSALRGDLPYVESRITRKDGEHRWVSFSLTPIEVGDETFNFGVTMDVTERKENELEREALVNELDAIDQIADAALSTLEPDALLEGVLSRLLAVLNANVGIVATPAKTWVVMRDGDDEPHRADAPTSIVNMRSFRQAPIDFGEEALGSLQVGWTVDRPSELRDDRILTLAAGRIGAAIVNSQLHSATSETARLNEALVQINELIHGSLDLESVMQQVLVDAAAALGVDAGVILVPEGAKIVAQYSVGFTAEFAEYRVLDRDDVRSFALMDKTGEPVVLADTLEPTPVASEVARKLGIRSSLGVPLKLYDEPNGLLAFFYRDTPHSFSESQVHFARYLANSISLALDNARLYAAEHEIADALQAALVEMPERVRGQKVAHAYRSARSMAGSVGGDFYDAFELEGGRAAIVIGDVSGKGLGAAVLTSLLKNAMRAHATDDDSPSVALAKTNRLTALQTDATMFATAILAVLDVETGELIFCNAGHPPMIIRRADGSVHVEAPNSPLIGAFEDMQYSESSIMLHEGDMVLFMTDGVLEARCNHELFGSQRVVDLIAEEPDAMVLVDRILEAATSFADEHLADDIAIVALRYTPPK